MLFRVLRVVSLCVISLCFNNELLFCVVSFSKRNKMKRNETIRSCRIRSHLTNSTSILCGRRHSLAETQNNAVCCTNVGSGFEYKT